MAFRICKLPCLQVKAGMKTLHLYDPSRHGPEPATSPYMDALLHCFIIRSLHLRYLTGWLLRSGILAACLLLMQDTMLAQKIKFTSGGIERSFILHLPKMYLDADTAAYPIILSLHGKGSNGREMKIYTGLNSTGDEMNTIVVYPTTLEGQWPYTDSTAIQREAIYLKDIIGVITSRYHGDSEQVYMTGMSSGGIFTFTFASLHPEALKGIAVVSGNITPSAQPDIVKNASILPPLLFIHGTADLLYEGKDGMFLTAEESFTTYLDACAHRTPIREWLPDTYKKDKCIVEKITYRCPEQTLYCRIKDGGHHWPGAKFNASFFTSLKLGKFCRDVNANDLIRDFILAIKSS
jgi:polyhydroxybutyrate depolymerase